MPGYILHLAAAKMLKERLENDMDMNAFMLGNLLPDVTKDKARTHFHDPKQVNQMIRYPELDAFINKYQLLMDYDIVFGYFYHLYVDRKFYKDFLPRIVTFLDSHGEIESERQKIEWVLIKRTGQKIPLREFYSDEYYYGDFTKMNSFLMELYQIPMNFDLNIENPGIEEVDVRDIRQLIEQMKEYIYLSHEKGNDLRVFEIQEILAFLREIAEEWENYFIVKALDEFIQMV